MESTLYGIFTLVGFVSEISLVRCAHSFDFRYFTNSCENPVRTRFPWSNLYISLSIFAKLHCTSWDFSLGYKGFNNYNWKASVCLSVCLSLSLALLLLSLMQSYCNLWRLSLQFDITSFTSGGQALMNDLASASCLLFLPYFPAFA